MNNMFSKCNFINVINTDSHAGINPHTKINTSAVSWFIPFQVIDSVIDIKLSTLAANCCYSENVNILLEPKPYVWDVHTTVGGNTAINFLHSTAVLPNFYRIIYGVQLFTIKVTRNIYFSDSLIFIVKTDVILRQCCQTLITKITKIMVIQLIIHVVTLSVILTVWFGNTAAEIRRCYKLFCS